MPNMKETPIMVAVLSPISTNAKNTKTGSAMAAILDRPNRPIFELEQGPGAENVCTKFEEDRTIFRDSRAFTSKIHT